MKENLPTSCGEVKKLNVECNFIGNWSNLSMILWIGYRMRCFQFYNILQCLMMWIHTTGCCILFTLNSPIFYSQSNSHIQRYIWNNIINLVMMIWDAPRYFFFALVRLSVQMILLTMGAIKSVISLFCNTISSISTVNCQQGCCNKLITIEGRSYHGFNLL